MSDRSSAEWRACQSPHWMMTLRCSSATINHLFDATVIVMHDVENRHRDVGMLCMGKRDLGRFWWHLVHCFPNIFVAKSCKRFPPHLNNVSTLPCATWNAHRTRATTEMSEKVTPKFILPQLWRPNSLDLNPFDYGVWKYCQRTCKNTHHWSGHVDDAITDEWLLQWRHDPAWPTLFSVAVSVRPDHGWVFWTPFCNILHTL